MGTEKESRVRISFEEFCRLIAGEVNRMAELTLVTANEEAKEGAREMGLPKPADEIEFAIATIRRTCVATNQTYWLKEWGTPNAAELKGLGFMVLRAAAELLSDSVTFMLHAQLGTPTQIMAATFAPLACPHRLVEILDAKVGALNIGVTAPGPVEVS